MLVAALRGIEATSSLLKPDQNVGLGSSAEDLACDITVLSRKI